MKIQSFGCSFLAGSDLQSPEHTWPAVIARELGISHENHAWPGVGNLYIMTKVLTHARPDAVAVINWTFIDRFDFCSAANEQWHTLRPSLDHAHGPYYFANLHGQYRDMLTSLTCVNTAVDFLIANGVPFVMTYLDDLLFETVDPSWHDPRAVSYLQARLKPHVTDFGGESFLTWSQNQGFEISDRLHPLARAHSAAASHWIEHVQGLVKRIARRS